MTQY